MLGDALKQRGFNVIVTENPTSQELRDTVNRFIGEYGYDKNNRLVIFFAGHGMTIDETEGYIVPSDAPDPIINEPGFFRLAISMEDVMAWARRIRSHHALFLFDSCFSGTLFETKSKPNPNDAYIRTLTAKPVRQFLTAGDAEEEVPAGNDFVRLFIQGLDGEADINRDGYVTGLEIGTFVQTTLPGLTGNVQSPQYGKIQNVRLRQGDIVFRSLTKPVAFNSPSQLPEITPDGDDTKGSPTVTPSEETPSLLQKDSQTILISKSTGVDYSPLRNLLAEGKWKEADEETIKTMLQAAGRLNEKWLKTEDIDNFSCEDLGIIDKLWLESSQGKFGFSVQKDIYEELGGIGGWNYEVWQDFGDRVGWRKGGDWLSYQQLTFNQNAPQAHLPSLNPSGKNELKIGETLPLIGSLIRRSSLVLRTVSCKM
ncbi:MAG: GUN4 domain-containing protein [Cyanobacteria bacterium J06621_8]